MEVTIVDLEEFTKKKAVYAKLGDYKINVNDVPVHVALKVNEYHKDLQSGKPVDIGDLLECIVVPVIQRSYSELDKEEIFNKFTYDQMVKVMHMICDCFFSAGSNPKKEDNKKKG